MFKLTQNTKKPFATYAKRNGAVYLGRIDRRTFDYHIVRGYNASNTTVDDNITIGTYDAHDYIALERINGRQSQLVIEVDIHTGVALPHFLVVANDTAPDQFSQLLERYSSYRHVPFSAHDTLPLQFKQRFSILARPDTFSTAHSLINSSFAEQLVSSRGATVAEISDTSLLLYPTDTINEQTIEHNVVLAVKLTKHIEQALISK